MAIENEDGAAGGGSADLLGGAAGAGDGGAGGGAGAGAGADGAAAGAEGGAAAGDAGATPDWFEKLSATTGEGETASNRDWVTSKGVKDLDGLVKITRDTERALREGGRIKVPGDDAKPEEVAAFRKSIGVPDDAKGYEIKGPEGVSLNEPLIGRLAEAAVKSGIPKGAFEATVNEFIQAQLDEAAQVQSGQDGEIKAKLAEWGGKQTEQLAYIDAAARGLGLTSADMAWFRSMPGGAGRALDHLAKLGAGMSEDTLISGGKGNFGIGGAEAQVQIDQMKADPAVMAKVMVAGTPERVRYDRLNRAQAEFRAAKDAKG